MFLACQQWIQSNNKLKFLIIWKNAVETSKIAVDSCYVLRYMLQLSIPSNTEKILVTIQK
jgi:hypothetical protein